MTADVALVLEGTYPFVPGGVSSWVHQLVTGLPDVGFELIHISPREGFYDAPIYAPPANVIGLTECVLSRPRPTRPVKVPRRLLRAYCEFLGGEIRESWRELVALQPMLQRQPDVIPALLHSAEVWDVIRTRYLREAADESFVAWFWNWICVHEPLLQVLATPLPDAERYHTVSTGYAGLLASIAGHRCRRPVLLTEHGIYTKERRIEIFAAEWIHDAASDEVLPAERASVFRQIWNEQFDSLSRVCYGAARAITTLYEGNRREQIQGGADPERCRIIPNGIPLEAFEHAERRHRERPHTTAFTVAFVGRVTPIKDVRTFLSAMRLASQEIPDLRVRILGPLDEDREYATECADYASQVGLDGTVAFEGRVDLRETLPAIDVVVLTSISEAQPLVVLEAGAVGIPVVCTDVGCCRELIQGRPAEGDDCGAGGIVTPIASPGATAASVLELWRDPERRARYGHNLLQRVRRFYDQERMLAVYSALYDEAAATVGSAGEGAGGLMAGIGFELRRLLYEEGGITAKIQALLAATMITAGPWLLTMATLLLISLFGTPLDEPADAAFRTLVTYAFAASMITVGALQMPMTRHLADRLHDRRYDAVLPAFVVASTGVGALQCATALGLGFAIGLRGTALVALAALYVAVSLNWLAMAWLTVIREHGRILAAFVAGLIAAVGLALVAPADLGLAGPLAAYAAGQGLTFLLLAALIGRGLEHGADRSPDVFRSVRRYPQLLWVGLSYSLGVWIDKFVFWLGDGIESQPFLLSHPLYDTSCFLAYMTIVPAMVLNLIVLETRFYERYRRYYAALVDGQPLAEVEWLRGEMVESLREGAILMVRWQGLFTALAIVGAPLLLGALGLPDGMVRPFRLACVGAFFQVFLLITVLVLLYFDLRSQALRACALFVALNGLLALLSLLGGLQVYGAGYAVAGLLALIVAWCSLQRALPRLEYLALARAAGYGR